MAVYQEKDKGTWRVVFRYTDFTGERKQTQKRGFKTKREATAWEHEMMLGQRRRHLRHDRAQERRGDLHQHRPVRLRHHGSRRIVRLVAGSDLRHVRSQQDSLGRPLPALRRCRQLRLPSRHRRRIGHLEPR